MSKTSEMCTCGHGRDRHGTWDGCCECVCFTPADTKRVRITLPPPVADGALTMDAMREVVEGLQDKPDSCGLLALTLPPDKDPPDAD